MSKNKNYFNAYKGVERSQSGPIFGGMRGNGLLNDLNQIKKSSKLPLELIVEEDEKIASDGAVTINHSQRALLRHSDIDLLSTPFKSKRSGGRRHRYKLNTNEVVNLQ